MTPVERYINGFPEGVQSIMQAIRAIIFECAPDAAESIAYSMPAYKTHGKPLVYFAAYKNHIGFYATPSGHEEFREILTPFKHAKGSVQFPLDKPIPFELIRRMVEFRVAENSTAGKP
jgi:uncharacterized protein YdhG (YjbR/CyaY superfamily)